MKHEHAELKLTITPQGLKRTDLLAIPDDPDSEETAIWLHSVLAQEIHRFRNNTKSILASHQTLNSKKGNLNDE